MRQAGLAALAAFLNLQSLHVNAETKCHTSQPPTVGFVANYVELHNALAGPVADLCATSLHPGTDEVINHSVGDVMFNIARNKTAQDAKECNAAFALIVSHCVGGHNAGGTQTNGDIIYDIHHITDDVDQRATFGDLLLDSRAPKAGKVKAKPKPKPKPKPSTKPKPTTKPKPKTTAKPKPTSSPKSTLKSSSAKATKTSSSVKPGATKTCKQMHALMLANQKKAGGLAKREGFVGSRLSIEKRAGKSTQACGMSVDALPYPEKANMPAAAKYYGFKGPHEQCDIFGFADTTTPADPGALAYEIEHVLEWQTVTSFFDWVNEQKKADIKFKNPNPGTKNEVDFCMFWERTWSGAHIPTFTLGTDENELTPLGHLAQAYPGKTNHVEEFVWLQTLINRPAKANVWAYKGKTDSTAGAYDTKKTTAAIQGKTKGREPNKTLLPKEIDKAKEVLLDLKYLMGVRAYMRDSAIEAIFKKQKERIGDMLDVLDAEVVKHQRVNPKTDEKYGAWTPQKLKALWDEYMNERFRIAKARIEHDMDTFLALLEKEWTKTKDSDANEIAFDGLIDKVKKEWVKEKAHAWTKPW